jgi:hypothetical protein
MAATGRAPGLALRRVDVVGPHPAAQLLAHLDGLQVRLHVVVRVDVDERARVKAHRDGHQRADRHLVPGDVAEHIVPGDVAAHPRIAGHPGAHHRVARCPVEGGLHRPGALGFEVPGVG